MPFVNIQSFNPTNITISDVTSNQGTGTVIIVTRPNSAAPAFLLMVTDAGELFVFDKTGSLAWTNNTGIAGINEASINQNGQVLTRVGTTLRFYDTTGTLVWTQTIANLEGAKVGTSSVACAINDTTLAGSGFQWRSLADGSVLAGPLNLTNAALAGTMLIAAGSTGDIAIISYIPQGGSVNEIRDHKGQRSPLSLVWTADQDVIALTGLVNRSLDTNSDTSITIGSSSGAGGVGPSVVTMFDTGGARLGGLSFGPNLNYRVRLNPVGNRAVVYLPGATGANAVLRIVASPFGSTDFAIAYTLPTNNFAADVSDEMLFFICDSGGQIVHVYNDSIVQAATNTAHGVANMMVAVVRNV